MLKLLSAALLVASSAVALLAQDRQYSGVMRLECGFITLPNGQRVSAKGLMVPWKAVPAKIVAKGQKPPKSGPDPTDNVVIYENDNAQNTYNGIGVDCPSSLDDIQILNSGVNMPWQNASFGIQADSNVRVLIRWQFFDDMVSGLGAGHSAFINLIDDFGGYWTPPSANPWWVQFDWGAVYGFAVPDSQFWMAMQFREPASSPLFENGEGAFRTDYKPLFQGTGNQIGFSDDSFYFDDNWDGIYDETEYDHFDPPGAPNLANFAIRFDVSGSITEVLPQTGTVLTGLNTAGTIFDTWGSDDVYYEVSDNPKRIDYGTPIAVRIESALTGTVSTITSLRFSMESHHNLGGATQTIYLRNFTTNQWVALNTSTVGTTDSMVSALVPSTMTPSQFVRASDKKVWALVTVSEPNPFVAGPYSFDIDKCSWVVTRP